MWVWLGWVRVGVGGGEVMSDSEIEILGIFSWERPKETTSIEVFDLF